MKGASAWVRPQPIRDAIIAYLTEPRVVRDIALHINRPVPTTTGHLAAMRRHGLIKRVAFGVYAPLDAVVSEKLPRPKHPTSLYSLRRRLVPLLTWLRSVQGLSLETRLPRDEVAAVLHDLWLIGQVTGNVSDGYRLTASGRHAYSIDPPRGGDDRSFPSCRCKSARRRSHDAQLTSCA